MTQLKVSFALFSVLILFSFPAQGKKITLDIEGDMAKGFYHDHFESRKYFDSVEELLGVASASMNLTRIGIWLFESHGIGGCCGGQWDLTNIDPEMFEPTDSVEILVRYWSNKPLFIYGAIGDTVEIKEDEEVKDITYPPSSGSLINWRTIVTKLDARLRKFILISQLGVNRSGFIMLDKLVVGINEPAS